MFVPGSDLLDIALTAINPQGVNWYIFNSRELNAVGQYITLYNEPIVIPGSFQPVSRQAKFSMGLDWQKAYYIFYTSNDIGDIERDVTADLFTQGENVYQVESNTEWFDQDSWVGSLVVKSGLSVPALHDSGLYTSIKKVVKK